MRKLVCISESEGGDVLKMLRPSNASDWLSQNIQSKCISCLMVVVLLYVKHVTSLSLSLSLSYSHFGMFFHFYLLITISCHGLKKHLKCGWDNLRRGFGFSHPTFLTD